VFFFSGAKGDIQEKEDDKEDEKDAKKIVEEEDAV
jgi:hypothetical protein